MEEDVCVCWGDPDGSKWKAAGGACYRAIRTAGIFISVVVGQWWWLKQGSWGLKWRGEEMDGRWQGRQTGIHAHRHADHADAEPLPWE